MTRLLGVHDVPDEAITSEELRILVERGGEQGTIEAEEEQMIGGVLELGERRVHEVMVARVDIVALPVDASLDAIVQTLVSEGHSRIPVFEGSIDNIVGILYAKDLLPFLVGVDRPPTIRGLVRAPLFVPESMLVDDLLHSLQRRRVHIAIVLDEHGGTAGLVSIEDLIEEIVGEIQDEYDEEEPMIVPLGQDEARVDGRADVDDVLEHFDTALEGDDQEEFDTVGGLVYHYVGGVPRVGDSVEVDGLRLTVEATDGRRVRTVHVARVVPAAVEEPAPTSDHGHALMGAPTRSSSRGRCEPHASETRATTGPSPTMRGGSASRTWLRADGGLGDARQALDGLTVDDARRGDLREGIVAMAARLPAGVVVGPEALEDGAHLLDLRGGRLVRLGQDLAQADRVGAPGLLERVDERQRLLARRDVRGLLAGDRDIAPDAQQVIVQLEGQAQRPAEATVGGDDRLVVGGQDGARLARSRR